MQMSAYYLITVDVIIELYMPSLSSYASILPHTTVVFKHNFPRPNILGRFWGHLRHHGHAPYLSRDSI